VDECKPLLPGAERLTHIFATPYAMYEHGDEEDVINVLD